MTTTTRQRFEVEIVPHLEFLSRVARSMSRDDAEAEDLAQDTLVKAFRALDSFDGRHPKAWLARIARNTAINRDQRRREFTVSESDLAESPTAPNATTEAAEDIVLDASVDPLLRKALADLPPEWRSLIQLVDVEGFRYSDAAEVMEIPVGTVMSRLHRARSRLRQSIAGTHLEENR